MKRLIIFSTIGGGGHISVAYALNELLHERYAVSTVNVFSAVLGSIDPIKIVTLGFYSAENLYNALLVRRYHRLINLLYLFGRCIVVIAWPLIVWLIKRYLNNEKDEVILSVVPLINGCLQEACAQANVPFLIIPTDLDMRTFVYGIKPPYKAIKIAVPFEDDLIMSRINRKILDPILEMGVGFCLKQSFFAPKDRVALKKEFSIPSHKPVVMRLMGAAGAESMVHYVQTVANMQQSLHMIACIGRNSALQSELELIVLPPQMSITIIGLTNRIADLLAIADIFITKPGTVSVVEGMYSEVPMLLDGTAPALAWEALNLEVIEVQQFGAAVRSLHDLDKYLEELITDPLYYGGFKEKLVHFKKPIFAKHIDAILDQLFKGRGVDI